MFWFWMGFTQVAAAVLANLVVSTLDSRTRNVWGRGRLRGDTSRKGLIHVISVRVRE
jgi:hypothetical protein